MENFYVYVISKPDFTDCYVGKGKGRRYKEHLKRSHNRQLKNIVNKYPVKIEKISTGLDEKLAFYIEKFCIKCIGRKSEGGTLVNQGEGGEGGSAGRKMLEEERQKRRKIMSNPEVKEKLRLSHLGIVSGNKGKKSSKESKEKMRLSHLGKKQSQETKDKRANALRGQKRSKEQCKRMSIIRTGEKRSEQARRNISAGRIGMKFSPEHRLKITEGIRKYNSDPKNKLAISERVRRSWIKRRELEIINVCQKCN